MHAAAVQPRRLGSARKQAGRCSAPQTPAAARTRAALRQQCMLAARAVCVEDEGHVRVARAHRRDDALAVRQAELGKLLGAQVVRPRVEQLDHLRAGQGGGGAAGQAGAARWAGRSVHGQLQALQLQAPVPGGGGSRLLSLRPQPLPGHSRRLPASQAPAPAAPHLRARLDLVAHILGERHGEVLQQRVQHRGVAEHHGLGAPAVAVGLALHRVGGQGPGRADEAQQRGARPVDLLAQRGQRLVHKGQAGERVVHGAQRAHVVHAARGGAGGPRRRRRQLMSAAAPWLA